MGKKNKNNSKLRKEIKLPPSRVEVIDGTEVLMFGNEKIYSRDVAEASMEYSKLFGANKNIYRITPHLIDGCKPGMRRLLYAWWLEEKRPQNTSAETLKKRRFYKVQTLTSKCMEYHPHSDVGVQEMIGKAGQTFASNILYIDPQGSYGNLQQADPGAGRYIEARISEFVIDCFFSNYDNYCIPTVPAANGISEEPLYFPAKYPAVLFNPQFSGIGYGKSSNVPGFNVKEVLEATIELIKNPKAKILLIPDFPTGCDIVDTGLFEEINKTGQAKITMQATSEIDYKTNTIKFTSVPLQQKTKPIIKNIISMDFPEIHRIDDATQKGNVELYIELKPDANPDKVLEKLYKRGTGLRTTLPVGITVMEDFRIKDYGVRKLLLEWIEYRRDAVLAMMLNSLENITEKKHMNDVLIEVFSKDNIDDAVKIAKKSNSRREAVERFMKRFKITSLQAETLADMKLYQFSKDSYDRFVEEGKKLSDELKKLRKTVESDKLIDEFIINELEEGIKKYSSPRRSKVIRLHKDNDIEAIPDIDYLLGISESGMIKKIKIKKNNSIGSLGPKTGSISVMQINNREDILVVDSTGYITKVSVSSIPEMNFEDDGVSLSKFSPIKGSVKISMELPSKEALKESKLNIIFITKNGVCKQTPISSFKKLSGSKPGIILDKDDEVATAIFSYEGTAKDIIISTNKGNGIRLPINEIRTYGPLTRGLNMLSLEEGEYVTQASRIQPKQNLLFYITSDGKAKLTELKLFPVMKRLDTSLQLMKISARASLVGISTVGKNDHIILYKQNSDPEEILVENIPIKSRTSAGVKICQLSKGDSVLAYRIFKA